MSIPMKEERRLPLQTSHNYRNAVPKSFVMGMDA